MSVTSEKTQDMEEAGGHPEFDHDEKIVDRREVATPKIQPEAAALTMIESATGFSPPVDGIGTSEDAGESEFTPDYATGLTLAMTMMAINLSCFLMFLDNSILATVSRDHFISTNDTIIIPRTRRRVGLMRIRLYQLLPISFTQLRISDGTSVPTSLHCESWLTVLDCSNPQTEPDAPGIRKRTKLLTSHKHPGRHYSLQQESCSRTCGTNGPTYFFCSCSSSDR